MCFIFIFFLKQKNKGRTNGKETDQFKNKIHLLTKNSKIRNKRRVLSKKIIKIYTQSKFFFFSKYIGIENIYSHT